MDSDFYIKLSPKLYILLVFLALSPIAIVCFFFGFLESIIWTMVFFQLITLTLCPCFFIDVLIPKLDSFSENEMSFRTFFLNIFRNLKGQIVKSFFLMALIFVSVSLAYSILFQLDPEIFLEIKIPLKKSFMNYLALFLLLGVSNPWLEEWFWRVFLVRFYPNSEFWRLFATFNYACYHFFVLLFLTKQWTLALAGFLGIFCMGRFFLFLRMKFGFLVSGMTHMASDMCVVALAIINLNNEEIQEFFDF